MHADELAHKVSARRVGGEWRVRCPVHRGEGASLAFKDGDIGVVVYCHAHGCRLEDICHRWGIRPADLFYDPLRGEAIQRARLAAIQATGEGRWWQDRRTGALWIAANDLVRLLRKEAEAHRARGQALGEDDPAAWVHLEMAARLDTEAEHYTAQLDAASE